MYDNESMVQQFLNILLATSIFACPFFCKGGAVCCHGDKAAATHRCCEACHDSQPEQSDDQGSLPSPSSDVTDGCICGGAVIETSAVQLLDLDVSVFVALVETAGHNDLVVQREHVRSTPFLPDDDMNTGRAMRCLMMSFLC